MTLQGQYDFRDALVGLLERDLVGPGSPEEEITDDPLTRYIVGVLYPQSPRGDQETSAIDPAEDLDVSDEAGEDGPPDPAVALANVHYPSSLGLTFAVDPGSTKVIYVAATAARYEQLHGPNAGDRRRRRGSDEIRSWRRVEVTPPPVEVSVEVPSERRTDLAPGLQLYVKVRREQAKNAVVTTALINVNVARRGELRDSGSFFQPRIVVDAPSGSRASFLDRGQFGRATEDDDLRLYALLYRHVRVYAVGHGCSANWEVDERGGCVRTWSEALPRHEVLSLDSNRSITGESLSARFLAGESRNRVVSELGRFVDDYDRWIRELTEQIPGLPAELQAVARQNVDVCREAASRMRRGTTKLEQDDIVFKAFQLANSALDLQTRRKNWIHAGRPESGPEAAAGLAWYPFQLGFLLVCLQGIAEPESAERAIVDLLWFPTGGGKTEAYLALIALTIFLRRIRYPGAGGGVTAIMRYTLRLLTIQQFDRAALLVCACETIRASTNDLGSDPISVGLWVGQDATPNDRATARRVLDKLRRSAPVATSNPVQLHRCPWCGTDLDHTNYYLSPDEKRLVVACGNSDCDFRDGLPVFLVDEDIYDWRPTLLISTVDKFASMPWREEVARIFGADDDSLRPPELIIQDELHLISGPLGTLTGLYETVVDEVCSRRSTRPKIVASTATIRRARSQVSGLFNREVRQFPPPGLDARDSYFAVQPSRDQKASRLYVGAMPAGSSHTTLMIRTYAALLHGTATLDGTDKIRDPYWTLVGYFNSLRVLGGARMQVQDDVGERLEVLGGGEASRDLANRIELTSREPSGEIPRHLRAMGVELPSEEAVDVILATNMISVGVDVNRLGLMVVMGQPQATSEYIQATSRVGRQYPGLVVTLYNAARSRDRSHYESFSAYHAGLYRQVESTSVTTFSARARDRGLHAVFIGLARLLVPELRPNRAARDVANAAAKLDEIKQMILDRVARVAPEELAETRAQLDQIAREWIGRAESGSGLRYRDTDRPERALLVDAASDDDVDGFRTLWSLRDVDKSSNLYIVM